MSLPILATASDVREVVKFLKRKPEGIHIVEAKNAIRQRLLDPRKVAAYEFWGVVSREGERLKLTPLGWEFARQLEPETQTYRTIFDQTEPYRSVLRWIHRQNLNVVTQLDVAEYWQAHCPEALASEDEQALVSSVHSFFHLCQAAELGIVTLGRKRQPGRLSVDHTALTEYIEADTHQPSIQLVRGNLTPDAPDAASVRPPAETTMRGPHIPRVFISCNEAIGIVTHLRTTLVLVDMECKIVERKGSDTAFMTESLFQSMRGCDSGIIVVTNEDRGEDGKLRDRILIEIGAALVHFEGRLALAWDKGHPVPKHLECLILCEFEGDALDLRDGTRMIQAIKPNS